MKDRAALLGFMAMAMSTNTSFSSQSSEEEIMKLKHIPTKPKVIPKGCEEYVFNESFGTLKVVAINKKSALKKYNKWYKANQSQGGE